MFEHSVATSSEAAACQSSWRYGSSMSSMLLPHLASDSSGELELQGFFKICTLLDEAKLCRTCSMRLAFLSLLLLAQQSTV